jgi:hypothetical protein
MVLGRCVPGGGITCALKGSRYLALNSAAKMGRSMEGVAPDAIEQWDSAARAVGDEYLQRG